MNGEAVTPDLPDRTEVLVIGGGIVGCSVAYHLTRRGITDVTVIEQGKLTGGTTWHAAGLVSQLKSSHSLTALATYSARLYEELEDETGQATGYRTSGSISVAADDERWEEILRGASMAKASDVVTEVIDLDRAKEMWPLLNTDDLVGALYIPHDGQTSPIDTTMALAKGGEVPRRSHHRRGRRRQTRRRERQGRRRRDRRTGIHRGRNRRACDRHLDPAAGRNHRK